MGIVKQSLKSTCLIKSTTKSKISSFSKGDGKCAQFTYDVLIFKAFSKFLMGFNSIAQNIITAGKKLNK